ncbi:hypothetical protein ID866_3413, partial [Astraeus odoratus]
MTRPQNLGSIVWLYVPPLIMHTILFALKLYRFARSRGSLHVEAPLRRFLKEGMLMYTLATGSLVFTIICLTFTQPSQISVFLLALARCATVTSTLPSYGYSHLGLSRYAQHRFIGRYVPCRSSVASQPCRDEPAAVKRRDIKDGA